MKKKVILISILFVILSFIIIISFSKENRDFKVMSNINKDKQIINSNMLTLMYETESGSGIYEETKDTNWPASGYIFNETLSGCENGGELEYNSQNNTVNLLSNKSDKCYVYFDKYDGVWIDDVIITNVTGSSVTLSVSATSENGSISKYYYSINDSEEYIEASSNVITISDLNKLTEYKISIYCLDSTNAKSNIYEVKVSTTDESKPVINSVEVSNITDSGFTLTVNATSDVEISKYYFTIDGEGENNAGTSTTNSYTFNNLESATNYNLMVFVEDVNGNFSNKYSINTETSKSLYVCNSGTNFSSCIKSLYVIQGSNGLYYHTSSLANSAGDNSYRYAGVNPNNYVCFGSDATTCPSDNLYRIIGIFDNQAKLIKATIASHSLLGTNGTYQSSNNYLWSDPMYNNSWSNSELNTINLNTNFIASFSLKWQNQISVNEWKVGGMENTNAIYSYAKQAYNYEVGVNSSNVTYDARIGLMYISDYYYAAFPTYWTYPGYTRNGNPDSNGNYGSNYDYRAAKSSNWMNVNTSEWTITGDITYSPFGAFFVRSSGDVFGYDGMYMLPIPVRPTFYLDSNSLYYIGDGSIDNPFRIVV